MEGGLVSPTEEGTPQGGPLSPLLSNLMLDVLDKELEKRGHRFVRYADDCNIYVRSQKAGERVMAGIEKFLAKRLKLKVNKAKSAVAKPSARKFLGFSFTSAGAATSASAKLRRCCARLTSGSGDGCAPSPGSNGGVDALASPNCDTAASAGTWRHKPPVAHMALGGWQRAPRSTWPCQSSSSGHSVWLPSRPRPLNPSNRRIRTRTSGGVGGAEPRGSPLSRLSAGMIPHRLSRT